MKCIAVLGSGLLGGSIVLAVQVAMPHVKITLWGRSDKGITDAKSHGVEHATSEIASAVDGADLIILATPVGAMLSILELASQSRSLKGVTITDVGSVKLTPRDTLKNIIYETGSHYIGSHPMAGSEQAGVSAAQADLFQGAACILTNDFSVDENKVSELSSFWQSLGCRCHITSSEDHDRALARISHLPHMLASVGALVGLENSEDAKYAGNGMRDTTRVASGHPAMWAEIFVSNGKAMREPIQESINHLREMLALIDDSSEEALANILEVAKQRRDML